jgi:undecaprenyl-diphosphatase
MNFFHAIFLGLLQGVTEFLPISSSGHLALVEFFLGIKEAGLTFDVALHLGTLLGVIIYFRRDFFMMFTALVNPRVLGDEAGRQRLLALYLCLGTIPAVIAGYFLKDAAETTFRSPCRIFSERCCRNNFQITVPYCRDSGRSRFASVAG